MYKVTVLPHPSPPVAFRPNSFQPYPVAMFRSCAALLSCPVLSCCQQNGNGTETELTAAQHRDGNGNETGTHSTAKGTQGNERTNGTKQGTERRNGTEARKERGKAFLPSILPFPLFLPFPSFSHIRVRERKKYFRFKKAFFRVL